MKHYNTIIIGGGASGMAAAVCLDKSVAVFEAGERLGKKLLATGNGKCNLLNNNLNESYYNDKAFVSSVFKKCGFAEINAFFASLGLVMKTDKEGRLYPFSESASSVLDVLRLAVSEKQAEVFTGNKVTGLEYNGKYVITVDGERFSSNNVVFAAGSNAGGGFDSLSLLSGLIGTQSFKPSLTPLITDTSSIKGLAGIRVKCLASLIKGEKTVAEEEGEILFKDFGLSGIAAFNLSGAYAREKEGRFYVSLNLLSCGKNAAKNMLIARKEAMPNVTFERFFTGLLHKMLSKSVTEYAGFKQSAQMSDDAIPKLAAALTDFRLLVQGTGNATLAQVSSGGVLTEELSDNLEAKALKGLYVVGEAVNVDGLCGGYNLSWAWASALTAARAINGK